jgi:hypothetical protein
MHFVSLSVNEGVRQAERSRRSTWIYRAILRYHYANTGINETEYLRHAMYQTPIVGF